MPGKPHGDWLFRHTPKTIAPTRPTCSPGPGPGPRPPRRPTGHSRESGNPFSFIARSRVQSPINSSSPRRRGPSVVRERHWRAAPRNVGLRPRFPAFVGMRGWPGVAYGVALGQGHRATDLCVYRRRVDQSALRRIHHRERMVDPLLVAAFVFMPRSIHPTFFIGIVAPNHHANSSSSAFASIKSFVSKPSVNQP